LFCANSYANKFINKAASLRLSPRCTCGTELAMGRSGRKPVKTQLATKTGGLQEERYSRSLFKSSNIGLK